MECKSITLHHVTAKCPKNIPGIRRIYISTDIKSQEPIKYPFDPIKSHNILMNEIKRKNSDASNKAVRELTVILPQDT